MILVAAVVLSSCAWAKDLSKDKYMRYELSWAGSAYITPEKIFTICWEDETYTEHDRDSFRLDENGWFYYDETMCIPGLTAVRLGGNCKTDEYAQKRGYFTLATKMLTLKRSSLSKTECKSISRFGYFDEDSQSYKLPAVLIAQFSRNFSENSKSISGSELMDIALDKIRDILHSTSGKAVFLECEQSEKIIDFYTRHNFQPLGNTVFSKDNKELTQLYMIL